jgi:hypothetical protein
VVFVTVLNGFKCMLHIEFSGVLEKHFCEIMETLIAGAIFYCRTPYVLPTVKMSTKSVKCFKNFSTFLLLTPPGSPPQVSEDSEHL